MGSCVAAPRQTSGFRAGGSRQHPLGRQDRPNCGIRAGCIPILRSFSGRPNGSRHPSPAGCWGAPDLDSPHPPVVPDGLTGPHSFPLGVWRTTRECGHLRRMSACDCPPTWSRLPSNAHGALVGSVAPVRNRGHRGDCSLRGGQRLRASTKRGARQCCGLRGGHRQLLASAARTIWAHARASDSGSWWWRLMFKWRQTLGRSAGQTPHCLRASSTVQTKRLRGGRRR